MKKILFIATIESHILNFHIPFIEYFYNKGYEVHVAAKLGNRQDELKDLNVVCHDVNFSRSPYSLSNIRALNQLIKTMRENKFSLVHVHTPVGAFLGRLAAKITNTKPVLYTAHGFHFYKGAPLKNWLIYYTMEKIAAHWTDGFITMNEEDFNIAKKFNLRRKDAVFYVHGVGLDIEKYSINDEERRKKLREELGFSDNDILLLTVAEINTNKNHKQIIDTIKILKDYSSIYYLIVGTGEEEEKLKNYVLLNNLEERIKFLGYRRDISEILNAIDIFILTSLREGLPRAIMEAMAAGKPIIATNVRGNRDLVRDGVNGYLVPVNDIEATAKAITKLAENTTLRTKMGEEGRRIIQDYDIKKVLREMDEIYSLYL
ncbi:Glycosyltransferase involved in cell wall bisynthesis [Thermoanaerobacter uzonensis DSM 18761]|uniref:Glycosyltransferase involved in cell wall bisynthesis n=1 Tax=Thermoanaerobacter uzonensis DSM 18761 TaxID=1123369 RepID=A0A1M5APE9_9THEO|nr:glycosyltransferase family 4 protein [Thermoanaerobacter uzonensis]SHF32130.1 Glycosyltransferase involved in cell wall bisynthesis [Thermoanaerobacter uzonensis DSM 18761]